MVAGLLAGLAQMGCDICIASQDQLSQRFVVIYHKVTDHRQESPRDGHLVVLSLELHQAFVDLQ